MTGRERFLQALQSEPVDRVPWLPLVGSHAAALIGRGVDDLYAEAEHLIEGARAALERYQPDALPVCYDLQLEAELLGCDLEWRHSRPPRVSKHILVADGRLGRLEFPHPEQGRLQEILKATQHLHREFPETAWGAVVTGPFTLALHLTGVELFMQMFNTPALVQDAIDFCSRMSQKLAHFYLEAGADFILLADPMASQTSPQQFQRFIQPALGPVIDAVHGKQAPVLLATTGNPEKLLQEMTSLAPDGLLVDADLPLATARKRLAGMKISLAGNIEVGSSLLLGSVDEALRDATTCLERGGERGFILATGRDIPFAAKTENLDAIATLVQQSRPKKPVSPDIPDPSHHFWHHGLDYEHLPKVYVDVFVMAELGSVENQYMTEAVQQISETLPRVMEWRLHRLSHRESLIAAQALNVRRFPTICIDGEATFAGRVPPQTELAHAIMHRHTLKRSRK